MRFEHAVNPLPRYYLVWMMLVTLPLYVAPLAAVGQLSVLRRVWQQRTAALRDPVTLALTAASLCWFVPLLFAVLTRPLVYNGWRHFYFVYAGVVLLGARGLSACIGFLRRRTGEYGMHRRLCGGLCLFFAWTAGDIAKNHPYQYAYYNRLGHKNAETQMELDYWVVSTRNAMQRLLKEPRDESLPLQIGARDDMSRLGLDRSFATLAARGTGGAGSGSRPGSALPVFQHHLCHHLRGGPAGGLPCALHAGQLQHPHMHRLRARLTSPMPVPVLSGCGPIPPAISKNPYGPHNGSPARHAASWRRRAVQ